MRLPPGMSEEQVVEVIKKVVKNLSYKFRFGYNNHEDLQQQGARFAIEALNKGSYDPSRPLENFLYTHVRNRFINYKRDNYIRNEPPCLTCIFYDKHCKKSTNQCAEFTDKMTCGKFKNWQTRNAARKSLMHPVNIESIGESSVEYKDCMDDSVDFTKFKNKIDADLPVELRSDYLKMLDGVSVPKGRRLKVREAMLRILMEYRGVDDPEEVFRGA
jgi:hypothetical protein